MAKKDWEHRWRSHGGAPVLDELGREILTAVQESLPEWRRLQFLEVGAGSGTLSLELARAGPTVAMVDFASSALRAIRSRIPPDLGVRALAVADAQRLPFHAGAFDVVWSSGLLEHFSEADLAKVLEEMGRVSRRYVLSFVPNLNSSFYLLWSYLLRLRGEWTVGYESPKASLRYAFENAGLRVLREFTIGFLPERFLAPLPDRLRDHLAFHYRELPPDRREGYLLVTLGVKSDGNADHKTVDYTEDQDRDLVPRLLREIRQSRTRQLLLEMRNRALSIMRRTRGRG